MEEYVVADLVKSDYIVNAAILDPDGFIIAALPDDEKTKQLLSKLAEVQYVKDNTSQTTIIAEKNDDYDKPISKKTRTSCWMRIQLKSRFGQADNQHSSGTFRWIFRSKKSARAEINPILYEY